MTRKEFFKNCALLGISLPFLSSFSFIPKNKSMQSNKDQTITIIGAGISGLVVAKALQNAGYKVVILEARDRIGGRILTEKVGDATIDLGAAWMHGTRGNPVTKYAKSHDLIYSKYDLTFDRIYDTSIGRIKEANKWDGYKPYSFIQKAAYKGNFPIDSNISFEQGLQQAFAADKKLSEEERRLYRFTLENVFSSAGGPIKEMSSESLILGKKRAYAGKDMVFTGGYKILIESLAKGLDIRTGTIVSKIDYSGQEVVIETNQEIFKSDKVLVTLPLGVLKSGDVSFTPALPQEKQDAIDKLGVCSFEKVVMTFDKKYWDGKINHTLLHISEFGENRAYPFFVDFSDYAGAPTLICILSGGFARKTVTTLDDAQIVNNTVKVLRTMLGNSLPNPVATQVTNWTNDPFSKGSYNYFKIGSSKKDMEALAKPVNDKLLFAGDATIEPNYHTVPGAFLSGIREAKRIDEESFI